MARKKPDSTPVFGVREQGSLLDLKLDLSRPMGIVYERCLNFFKGNHAHERMVICAARGATRAQIRDARTGKVTLNHAGVVVVKPPNFRHSVKSLTTVYDDIALLPTAGFARETGLALGFSETAVRDFLAECRQVGRSPWLDQLIAQYFARRCVAGMAPPEEDLAFFEREILRELLSLTVGPERKGEGAELLPGALRKALAHIEANLFGPLPLEELARVVGVSRSTLLRLFAEHLRTTPPHYIRGRRMDEARAFLRNSGKSVAEVAELVGYNDASAFSRAYRRQFGESPGKS